MELEKQVASLASSKRLKELGVKQESLFTWCEAPYYKADDKGLTPTDQRDWILVQNPIKYGKRISVIGKEVEYGYTDDRMISAFTVAELGEMLPDKVKYEKAEGHLCCGKQNNTYFVEYCKTRPNGVQWFCMMKDLNEAEARAKMLIYLIENNLCPSNRKDG